MAAQEESESSAVQSPSQSMPMMAYPADTWKGKASMATLSRVKLIYEPFTLMMASLSSSSLQLWSEKTAVMSAISPRKNLVFISV